MADEEQPRGQPMMHDHHHPAKMSPDEKHHHLPKESTAPPPYPRYGGGGPARDPRRSFCAIIGVLLLLVGITALTLWLVYRPHHPKFQVVNAAVYDLNTSAPPFITASMQFALLIRNPNKRVSIYYDSLSAYVSYKNLAITSPVALPPLFQESKSTVALSPVLGGAPVAVEAAELGNALAMDEAYGMVGLSLEFKGKVRYRYKLAGGIKSRRYGIYVRCDLLLALKNGFVGHLPLLGSPPCKVFL